MKLEWKDDRAEANGWGYKLNRWQITGGTIGGTSRSSEWWILLREPGQKLFGTGEYARPTLYHPPGADRSQYGTKRYAKEAVTFHAMLVERVLAGNDLDEVLGDLFPPSND